MNEFDRQPTEQDPVTPPPLPAGRPSRPARPTHPPQQSGGSGFARGCLVSVCTLLLGAVLLVVLIALAVGNVANTVGSMAATFEPERGVDEYPDLTEVWSAGKGDVKVVRISLRGMIMLGDSGGWSRSSTDGASAALRAIRRATRDPEVMGILLEIDSGGGGITASDILYNELLRFKQTNNSRIVVAHMGDIAASGAYYISLAADRILAHPTTITGSIGVILSSLNVRELTERLGIHDVSLKSGDNKDLLNPFGEMSEEQRVLLQEIVDQMHSRFVSLVAKHRNLDPKTARDLADGRIFLAQQAQDAGLIDGQAYAAEAQAVAAGLLGVPDIRLVRYEQSKSLRDLLRSPGFWGAALSEAMPQAQGRSTSLQLR